MPSRWGKTMQYKKPRVTLKHHGRPQLQKVVLIPFCESPDYQSLRPDLNSIVSAANNLPREIAPPARVWHSLRAQLEREGILSRRAKGRLEEQTRFPMFRN